jgi:two-component system OmpR family response regulator
MMRTMWILVVEDEPMIADAIRIGLEAEGFAVDHTDRGDDGLFRAQTNEYDAIILDIMLPKKNGYQVCAELRAAEIWTPVLMLTAKDGEYDEAEALDTGADDFLRKPFSFVVLLARLRALARRGAPARPAILQVGSLSLDPAAAAVQRDGVAIDLTRREFAVLEILLRANGDAVRRQDIIDRVWGFDDEPSSNVVEVYIRYLRKKIDSPFENPMIETVRGVGYRLVTNA